MAQYDEAKDLFLHQYFWFGRGACLLHAYQYLSPLRMELRQLSKGCPGHVRGGDGIPDHDGQGLYIGGDAGPVERDDGFVPCHLASRGYDTAPLSEARAKGEVPVGDANTNEPDGSGPAPTDATGGTGARDTARLEKTDRLRCTSLISNVPPTPRSNK